MCTNKGHENWRARNTIKASNNELYVTKNLSCFIAITALDVFILSEQLVGNE